MTYNCVETKVDWLSSISDPNNITQLTTNKTCGFFLNATSDTPVLMSGWIPTADPEAEGLEVLIGRIFPLFDSAPLYLNYPLRTWWDGSINFKNISNPIMDFIIVDTPDGVPGVYANVTPSAQECVLSWCVRRVKSEVYIGNLTQLDDITPMQPKGDGVSPWTQDSDLSLTYWDNFTYSPLDSNQTFSVSNETISQTILLMAAYFPMTVTGSSHFSEIMYRIGALQPGTWVRKIEIDAWAGDLAAKIDGLARLMTSVMMTSAQGVQNVEGVAWASEVFVSVRWKWFSLPFALLLLSLIFLLTTIFKSTEEADDIGIWKTSALPVLMNGLRGDVRRRMGDSSKLSDVRSQAREVDMKLQYGKKGYRLSNVPGSVWTSSPEQKSRTWI